jgi:hypothetical protein
VLGKEQSLARPRSLVALDTGSALASRSIYGLDSLGRSEGLDEANGYEENSVRDA